MIRYSTTSIISFSVMFLLANILPGPGLTNEHASLQLIDYYVREKYTLRYTGGMVPDVNQVIAYISCIGDEQKNYVKVIGDVINYETSRLC